MSDYQSFKDQKFSFKKPWLFGEYETMQSTIDEAEIYLGSGLTTIESQFKKPYNKLDHPTSENFFEGPPGTGLQPKINWGLPGNDCMPQGSAIGGGALNPCVPQLSCGQWAWTCAHRITKFTAIGGWIQSAQYGANDSVTVTVCWDESHSGSKIVGTLVKTKDGAVFKSKVPLDCLGPGHDNNCTSCLDCIGAGHTPFINFSSKQMYTSGPGSTQQFSAVGGGGGPYKWSLVSGGGTITSNGFYSAPATNANCTNNPVIRVKDYCGNTKDLKLAITDTSQVGLSAYDITICTPCGPDCAHFSDKTYSCVGTFQGNGGGCAGGAPGWSCASAPPCTGGTSCGFPAHGHDCLPKTYDDRGLGSGFGTKAGGCCPEALL